MAERFRIVQPYCAEVEVFEGAACEKIFGQAVLWETGSDPHVYPRDVLDGLLSRTPSQPFSQEGKVVYPGDRLRVQKQRALNLGRVSVPLGWKLVYERSISEYYENHALFA